MTKRERRVDVLDTIIPVYSNLCRIFVVLAVVFIGYDNIVLIVTA